MTFSEMLDRFQEQSDVLDLKQKVERLQFEVDFWANAESGETSKISRTSYQRRGAAATDALSRAREQYREALVKTGVNGG
jgi:hypothetical protein